jgi:sec-independent protein translocase protein TatC
MFEGSGLSTIWEHVSELLARLRVAIFAVVASTIAVLIVPIDLNSLNLSWTSPVYNTLATMVINRLRTDLLPDGVELIPLDWFAPFTTYIYVSIFLGVTISSPVIVYEIYKFIDPALYEHERKYIFLFVTSFTSLFLFGLALGYFVIVPITFRMLLGSTYLLGLSPRYEFSSFFSIVLGGLAMSGLLFTFPVFFLTLVKAGIVRTSMITGARKFLYVGIFVAICILTPDPTIVTDVIIFLPVLVLTEISVLIGKRIEKNRAKSLLREQVFPSAMETEQLNLSP